MRYLAALLMLTAPVCVASELDDRQAPYVGLSGKELLTKLSDAESRDRAYYELWRRANRGDDKGFASFHLSHDIKDIVICPAPDGSAPLTLILHRYPEITGGGVSTPYRIPSPWQVFPHANAEALQQADPPYIDAFAADGRSVAPYGEYDKLEGILGDFNRDGRVERVRLVNNYDGSKPARILEISAVEEHPRLLLSVIMDFGGEEWTYRLKDLDGDGIDEIELGPRVGPGIKPKAVYRWDAVRGSYTGPKGKQGSHFRLLSPENMPAELAAFFASEHPFSKDRNTLIPEDPGRPAEPASTPPPSKPYQKQKLDTLSDASLLARMGRGSSYWDYEQSLAIQNNVPRGFWTMPPRAAALAMAKSNRTLRHAAALQLAFDDRGGATPPDTGSVSASLSSSICYNAVSRDFFLRADPSDSYLALGGAWSGGVVFYNLVFDQPAFDLRLCRIPYADAKQMLATLWWMDRLRTCGFQGNSGRYSTADGGSHITLRNAGGDIVLDRDATLWYGNLSENWTASYDQSAFTSFAAYLMYTALPEKIGRPWTDAEPEESQDAGLRLDRPPHYGEAERKRITALTLEFLGMFSPTQDRLSYSIVAVAADAAGTLAIPEAVPLLEKITAALPAVEPPKRDYKEIMDEQEKLESTNYTATPAQRLANDWRLEELDAESKALSAYLASDGPAHLRAQADFALRRIAVANDPAALLAWAKSLTFGCQWAFQRLREIDPTRYQEALEWQLSQADPKSAEQILTELRRIAPDRVEAILAGMSSEKKAALPEADPPQVSRAKALPDPSARTAALLAIVGKTGTEPREVAAALATLAPADAPLGNDDKTINETLQTALDARASEPIAPGLIARALARRGCTEAYDRMQAFLLAPRHPTATLDWIAQLAPLVLLTQTAPETLSPKLEALLEAELKTTNKDVDSLLWAVWAADLRKLKPQIEILATSGPDDYEDRRSLNSTNKPEPITGRFHLARKIADLWNSPDSVTTIRLLTGFALEESLAARDQEMAPILEPQLHRQLRLAAASLTPAQRQRLDEFFAVAEGPAEYEDSSRRREIVDEVRKTIGG